MDRLARGFAWVQAPWGPVVTCLALSPIAVHGWTTRALALERPDDQCTAEWSALAGHAELTYADLSRLTQVHGHDIVQIQGPGTAGLRA